jgi:tetratricopeptide (TPR) repeat protein
MLNEADAALRKKQFKYAQTLYELALEHGDDKALAHLGISISAFHLKKPDAAVVHALSALEISPDLYKPHLILAYIYSQRGNLKDSEAEIRKALAISPESSDILSFGGGVLIAQNKSREAYEMLQRAKILNPSDWMVYYNLGSLYLTERKYRKSSSEYMKSLSLKRSIRTLEKLLVINAYIYRVPVVGTMGVMTLIAFYLRSAILLFVLTFPIIIVGLVAIAGKNRRGLLMVLLGLIPILLFFLMK